MEKLIKGKEYSFNESAAILQHTKFGRGMCASNKTKSLALYSKNNGPYVDKWVNGIFNYTGQGLYGDQTLTRENKILAEADKRGISIHLFIDGFYQGEVTLAGPYFIEKQKDINGLQRNVYIFPLKQK